MRYLTHSEKQTFGLGKIIAKSLCGGEVLALQGDLGAGKTVFTKGLAAGLGITKVITSPTFVLMKVYPGQKAGKKIKLVHLDCYRLTAARQLLAIGIKDYLNQPDCITVIEWAEKVRRILPKSTIRVIFKLGKSNNQRTVWVKQ